MRRRCSVCGPGSGSTWPGWSRASGSWPRPSPLPWTAGEHRPCPRSWCWCRSPGGAPATCPGWLQGSPPGSASGGAGCPPGCSPPCGRACPGRRWSGWPAGSTCSTRPTSPARRPAPVVTVHDLTYLRYPELVTAASARYRELVPRGLARGAVVCTPTAAVAAEVGETYRLPADRVVVTPLGLRPVWRSARPPDPGWLAARGLPARYLLFVGSREPRKGLDVLLAAYRELLADQPGAPPLVLAGPPGWGTALDLAGLPEGAVHLPGYLPEQDLASLTAGAAAMVSPSR